MDEMRLKKIIRQVVIEQLRPAAPKIDKTVDPVSGVIAVRTAKVQPQPFDTGKPGDQVQLVDLFSLEESPRLGCGVMEMTASSFDWTLKYDEIDYIIEGTLEIVVNGQKTVGRQGDTLFIPKNTSIQFSVPEFARFLYVTYPANWDQL